MALTLTEASKLSNDMLLQGVVETIVKDSPVLQEMPFIEITGNGLTYNQENTLPNIDFWVKKFKREIDTDGEEARQRINTMLREFNKQENLEETLHFIADQLMRYYEHRTPAGKNE